MKNKAISIVIVLLMVVSLCAGCSSTSGQTDGKLRIVTTVFPEYDWVKNIMGEKFAEADVTLLLDTGVDLHSFQPSADDIVKLSNCDLFIYIGGESDKWAGDALKTVNNEKMTALNLMEVLKERIKEEESVEGMQADEAEDTDETEYDEHIWLSLKNTAEACARIADELCRADSENAETYRTNSQEYINKLEMLDKKYEDAVSSAARDTVLFCDRFPFRYLFDDYGLKYYAAFSGCSAESEASFETVSFLSKKTDELGLNSVMTLEGTDHSIAETVINNTKNKHAKILSMNSMQSVTAADIENGADYIMIMESNLEILKTALS